jgi:putative chitinase
MTPGIDQLLAAGIKRDVAERWLPHVQAALARFGINTERQVAAWLAQTAHESGGYTMLVENLNYRAATMAACWPKRFAVLGQDGKPVKGKDGKLTPNKFALALERKPEAIANVVYASRMGNGPPESGDGWLMRGRGLKQLTGRDNVTRCGKALGVDLAANRDLLLEPEWASLSAAWFWSVNKCGPLADADDFVGLTKKINGGTIGLPDREKRYKAVLASLGY